MSGLISLDALAAHRAAVVGDVTPDLYVEGEVERISPEAPVPVMRLVSRRAVPGGGAILAALGARARLVAEQSTSRLVSRMASEADADRSPS